MAVGTEEDAIVGLGHGLRQEITVADADAVAVAHFGQYLQKLRERMGGMFLWFKYLLFDRAAR